MIDIATVVERWQRLAAGAPSGALDAEVVFAATGGGAADDALGVPLLFERVFAFSPDVLSSVLFCPEVFTLAPVPAGITDVLSPLLSKFPPPSDSEAAVDELRATPIASGM